MPEAQESVTQFIPLHTPQVSGWGGQQPDSVKQSHISEILPPAFHWHLHRARAWFFQGTFSTQTLWEAAPGSTLPSAFQGGFLLQKLIIKSTNQTKNTPKPTSPHLLNHSRKPCNNFGRQKSLRADLFCPLSETSF